MGLSSLSETEPGRHAEETPQRVAKPHRPTARLTLALVWCLGAALVFTQVLNLGPIRGNYSLADLFVIPLLFLLVKRFAVRSWLQAWLLAMTVMHVLSWVNGIAWATPGTLVQAIKLFASYAYALLGFGIWRIKGGTTAFAKGTTLSTLPVCVVSLIAFAVGQPKFFLDSPSRVNGPMSDPNAFGCYLAGAIPFVGAHWVGWLVLILAAVVTTMSRSGVAATLMAVVAWLALLRRRSRLTWMVLGLLILILGAAYPFVVDSRLVSYEVGLAKREYTWSNALSAATKHPWLGIGKGSYNVAKSETVTTPHNTYLSILVDNGVLGLVLFFVPVFYWTLRPIIRADHTPWAVVAIAGLVAGLAISLDDWRPFWLAMGALGAHAATKTPEMRQATGRS